jgi:hypothetical protein
MAATADMHPWFYGFPRAAAKGDHVQTDIDLVDLAASAVVFGKTIPRGDGLRVLNLAPAGEPLDFHLSFKCEAGFAGQAHFCVRREPDGKNAVLYWYYRLVRRPDGALRWTFEGCAGQGNPERLYEYRPRGVFYGSAANDCLNRLLAQYQKKGRLAIHDGRWTFWAPGK